MSLSRLRELHHQAQVGQSRILYDFTNGVANTQSIMCGLIYAVAGYRQRQTLDQKPTWKPDASGRFPQDIS